MPSLINNEKRANQIIDFYGILPPPLCLTDVDAAFEFHDIGYLFVEVKYNGKKLPVGQRKILERLTRRLASTDAKAVSIVVDHNIVNPMESIMLCDCKVREVYWGNIMCWKPPKKPCTAGEFINTYYNWLKKFEK